jgi:hypothetical protein
VLQHGRALSACRAPFDSCLNGTISAGTVRLTNYPAVIWALGQESVTDDTFNATEQSLLITYLNGGGHLFVTGSEIAFDLDRDAGPSSADRAFLHNLLRASLAGDANANAGTFQFAPAAGSIFAGNPNANFDDGTSGIYRVLSPNRITVMGVGARAALTYQGGQGGTAAVQYDGAAGGGKVVYFCFPFETIADENARVEYLADVLRFFDALPRPRLAQASLNLAGGLATFTWTSIPGRTYRLQWRNDLNGFLWNTLGSDIVATNITTTKTDFGLAGANRRFYRVLLVD